MKIKNKDLANVINFLDGVKAKGLKSIHRTRITNKLKSKFEELGEAQKQLQDEFKNDKENYLDEMKKLLDEHVTIDDTDSKVYIESLKSLIKDVLDDEEQEFNDGDALGLEVVYTVLEME